MNTTQVSNEIIRASAGTGKTFELASRYLRLLVDGVQPQSILATTFTRKAAGEILARVVNRLAAAALDEKIARQTAAEIDRTEATASHFADLLNQLIRNLNYLQIHTLDAFFAEIARAFSLEMGLPPDWRIVEEPQIRMLENRAIRHVLTRKNALRIVYDLAKGEAKRGVSAMMRNTVNDLYAIYRETHDQKRDQAWSRLKPRPVLPDNELDEIRLQLESIQPEGDKRFVKAFHKEMVNVRKEDWDSFLDHGLGVKVAEGVTTYHRKEIPAEIYDPMRRLAQHAVAISINQLVAQTAGAYEFLKGFHQEYDRLKFEFGALRFDDVNFLAQVLLNRYRPAEMAYRLDQQIDHLLLDEFQDTSVEQWRVLEPLAKRACQPNSAGSFFCVGDVKQAIYGWRGGVAEIFSEVEEQFGDALQGRTENKSWRSSQIIIDTINRVFSNLLNHKKLDDKRPSYQSWCDQFETHTTEHPELPGFASLEAAPDEDGLFAYAAGRIKELHDSAEKQSIGVLVRTNDAVARLIFELGRLGLAASEEGGNPLTDSAAVNLVLSMLRLIDHPDDMVSRYHVMNSPLAEQFGFTVENWEQSAHPCHGAASRFRKRLFDDGYGDVISDWARALETFCTRREWFRLGQLVEQGYRVPQSEVIRPTEFVNWAETTQVHDPSASRVRVMTIHKSKGLEFDVVVLPQLDFGNNRHQPAYIVGRDKPTGPVQLVCRYMDKVKREWLPEEFQAAFEENETGQIHERLSTMYVAMTRARQGLYMIVSPKAHAGHKSAAGLIMAGLGVDSKSDKAQASGGIRWQHGDPNWFQASDIQSAEPSATLPAGGELAAFQVNEIRFAPPAPHRFLPWESPSVRGRDDKIRLDRLLQFDEKREAKIHGSLVHACFEKLVWLDDQLPADDQLVDHLMGVAGADRPKIKKAIASFHKAINKPHTAKLLRRAQYHSDLLDSYDQVDVLCERKFVARLDDAILSGIIDRLVLLRRGGKVVAADIIDFKTDRLPAKDSSDLRRVIDNYRPQLLSYRGAIAKIYSLSPSEITARLLFTENDRVFSVA